MILCETLTYFHKRLPTLHCALHPSQSKVKMENNTQHLIVRPDCFCSPWSSSILELFPAVNVNVAVLLLTVASRAVALGLPET